MQGERTEESLPVFCDSGCGEVGILERRGGTRGKYDAAVLRRTPETASLHEASDAPECVTERHCRPVNIEDACNREFFPFGIEPQDHENQQETPVEDESALIYAEHFERIAGELVPEFNDIKDTGSDDAADNGNDPDIEYLVGRHIRISAFALKNDQRGEKTERNENAIPVNTQFADLKCDAVHDYGSVC